MDTVKRFLWEVWGEMKKVSWPSRAETIALTIMVMFLLVLLTLYIGLWDTIFRNIIGFLLNR